MVRDPHQLAAGVDVGVLAFHTITCRSIPQACPRQGRFCRRQRGSSANKNDGMNQSVTGPLGCHPSAARRLALCVVGVAVCLAVSLAIRSGVAQGATAPVPSTTTTSSPAPGLAFASTSPVLVETSTNHWSTRVVVTISSACPPGGTLWFWVVLPSNETVRSSVTARKVSCLSGIWQVLTENVAFVEAFPTPPHAATLVASTSAPTSPSSGVGGVATVSLTTQAALPARVELFWPLLGAGIYAVLMALLVLLRAAHHVKWWSWRWRRSRRRWNRLLLRNGHHDPLGPKPHLLTYPLYASASWTFKDSWATNLTAVGALLGTFLTAAGSVTTLFPGVPLYRFSILSALCGGIVVIAPLVVGVTNLRRNKRGSTDPQQGDAQKGLVLAAPLGAVALGGVVTMFAVGAELAFLGLLVVLSAATPAATNGLLVIVAGAAVIVLLYALSTTQTLVLSSAASTSRGPDRVGSALSRFADSSFTL